MKPSLPQGTRDFAAAVVHKRRYILDAIKTVFELHGFAPLETPAMENLETLMGKYGDEGDKLIFKILNNGLNDPKNIDKAKTAFENVLNGKSSAALTERALRYDLTIPFARYVAMNSGIITLPFKRYQMQPVWRADRPQRGRYREFYQCDADVVGSTSLLNEVDFALIYDEVFQRLQLFGYELRINSRKVLAALAEQCGGADKMIDITIAIDKLDKIGIEKVKEELAGKNLSAAQINTIESYLNIGGSNEEKLDAVKGLFQNSETGKKGIAELEYILKTVHEVAPLTTQHSLLIDLTLARGLNYYTGIIFEAKAPAAVKMGSIGGGGRYDDLTGTFGVPGIAGVGISFGVDRIYDVLEELNLFPATVQQSTRVLFFNLGAAESLAAYKQVLQVRQAGISAELYHEPTKLDKQFKWAEKKGISLVVIIGSKEIETATAVIKNISTGVQQSVALSGLVAALQNAQIV